MTDRVPTVPLPGQRIPAPMSTNLPPPTTLQGEEEKRGGVGGRGFSPNLFVVKHNATRESTTTEMTTYKGRSVAKPLISLRTREGYIPWVANPTKATPVDTPSPVATVVASFH